ncbi:uncharacterized protein LOC103497259 isoform X2 [Cucumis melo]|uniref:Uncharacterized protein LOC103497259 isoform X2 n=1 Tax=Cucumis melo TaxID=3656 RepID=A0ABM3L4Y6_CUCME|nr:uncharacterized protein LOC103497259 isoform X2 [Cucumis melo]
MILRKKGEEWEELLAVTEPMLRKGHGLLKKMRNTSLILKNMEPVVIGLLCLKKLAILPVVQKQHQLLVTLLLCNVVAMEALPIYLDKLFNQYVAIILSVTFILAFGEVCTIKSSRLHPQFRDSYNEHEKACI